MAETSKRPRKQPARARRHSASFTGAISVLCGGLALAFLWASFKPGSPPSDPAAAAAQAPVTAPAPNATTSVQPSPQELPPERRERALHQETLDAVDRLLKDLPGNDDAVYLAGLVHNDMGDAATAIRYWRTSVELDPSRVDGWDSLGKALLDDDQYEAAEEHFRRAMEIDATLPEPRFHLATALSHQGKLDEVVALLDGASQLDADSLQLLGETCQELGQLEQAKTAFEKALALRPKLMNAHYALSQVCTRLGDTEQAAAHWEKFSALKQESDEASRQQRDDFSPLANAIGTASQAYTDIGRVYASQQEMEKAEAAWQRARALDPHNTFCRVQLAAFFRQARRPTEALTVYQELAAIDTNDPLIQLNLGYLAIALDRFDQAIGAFREVIRLAPERPEGYSALSQLYLQTRLNPRQAVELAERAAQLSPTARNYVALARTHAANKNPAAAVAALDEAIRLEPDNASYFALREKFQSGQP